MPFRSMLAKDWVLEVNLNYRTDSAVDWSRVIGLSSFGISLDDNTEDDSDFDNDGWGGDAVTQRKWALEAEGRRKRDTAEAEFTPNAAQQAILDAGWEVGEDGEVHVRWYRRDGSGDAREGYANVSLNTGGGGTVTDLEPFNFTLRGIGKAIVIANPAAA